MPMKKDILILFALLIIIQIHGDTVYLKSGRIIEDCQIKKEGATSTITQHKSSFNINNELIDRIETTKENLSESPSSKSSFHTYAHQYFRNGQYLKAVPYYNLAIRKNPDNEQLHEERGDCFRFLGKYIQALKDYDKCIEIHPGTSDCFTKRGITYMILGQFPNALENFNHAIKLSKDSDKAYHQRGMLYLHQKEYSNAFQNFEKAAQLQPENAKYPFHQGVAKVYSNKNKQAVYFFSRAISLDPNYGDAYYNRALIYQKQGNKELFKKDLLKWKSLETDTNQ